MSARLGRAKMPVASVPKDVAKAVMAASVGANNVNGPGPESVPRGLPQARPAEQGVIRAIHDDVDHRVLAPTETMNDIAAAMSVKNRFINEWFWLWWNTGEKSSEQMNLSLLRCSKRWMHDIHEIVRCFDPV